VRKVADVRAVTMSSPPANIHSRDTTPYGTLEPVTVSEVSKLVSSMPARSCQLDPIPTWLLKQFQDIFAPVMTSLCNASFQSGVLPASQKRAVVLPRLKKSTLDPGSLSSYRPISNLSFLSKLIERVAAKRFVHHAEVNRLFPVHQSSYRRGHSTETAVLCVHNDLVRAVDEKDTAALVLLDLSAAFDTVDQPTLLAVLQRRFGVQGPALQWFTSYLSDRSQVFCMNDTESQTISVQCSVPQGSVLGPVKFIAYTDEVSPLLTRHAVRHHLYADDKQVFTEVPPHDIARARSVLVPCIVYTTSAVGARPGGCSSMRAKWN